MEGKYFRASEVVGEGERKRERTYRWLKRRQWCFKLWCDQCQRLMLTAQLFKGPTHRETLIKHYTHITNTTHNHEKGKRNKTLLTSVGKVFISHLMAGYPQFPSYVHYSNWKNITVASGGLHTVYYVQCSNLNSGKMVQASVLLLVFMFP